MRVVAADRGDAGRRLDCVVRRHLGDVPAATRTRVQLWIEQGRVAVNSTAVCKVSARVAHGDIVEVDVPDTLERPRAAPLAENLPLQVAFEDEFLMAVCKPAGMVTHPTYRHSRGTMLNGLLWHARAWPAGLRPSVVGRLDKGTSGLVLVAKTTAVHAALQRTLVAAASEKQYLAVVHGRVRPARGTIELPLARDPRDRRRVIAADFGALSLTRFERLTSAHGLTLLRCRILTGRMHQIRVHLAAQGWPVAGDPKYGDAAADTQHSIERMALHARRLIFVHPVSRQELRIEAPVPEDLAPLLTRAGTADLCL